MRNESVPPLHERQPVGLPDQPPDASLSLHVLPVCGFQVGEVWVDGPCKALGYHGDKKVSSQNQCSAVTTTCHGEWCIVWEDQWSAVTTTCHGKESKLRLCWEGVTVTAVTGL